MQWERGHGGQKRDARGEVSNTPLIEHEARRDGVASSTFNSSTQTTTTTASWKYISLLHPLTLSNRCPISLQMKMCNWPTHCSLRCGPRLGARPAPPRRTPPRLRPIGPTMPTALILEPAKATGQILTLVTRCESFRPGADTYARLRARARCHHGPCASQCPRPSERRCTTKT